MLPAPNKKTLKEEEGGSCQVLGRNFAKGEKNDPLVVKRKFSVKWVEFGWKEEKGEKISRY